MSAVSGDAVERGSASKGLGGVGGLHRLCGVGLRHTSCRPLLTRMYAKRQIHANRCAACETVRLRAKAPECASSDYPKRVSHHFRDYDPAPGRYVESDPNGIKGGINTYAYVASDPVWDSDQFGRTYRSARNSLWLDACRPSVDQNGLCRSWDGRHKRKHTGQSER